MARIYYHEEKLSGQSFENKIMVILTQVKKNFITTTLKR